MPRAEVEERLEVTGRGLMTKFSDGIGYVLRYPACGYDVRAARVRIEYRGDDDTVWAADRYISRTATLHGHN